MRARSLLLFALAVLLLGSVSPRGQAAAAPTASTAPVPGLCTEIDRPDVVPTWDARWKFCVPTQGWNGDVVVWAHGYVAPGDPATYQDAVPGSPPIALPALVQSLGYAFIASTYPRGGLVVLDAQKDLLDLVAAFNADYPPTGGSRATYLVGASMGGLVTTLLAEGGSRVFDGALAACGVSDLRRQITYWGDFRVLFDYFYPGLLGGVVPAGTVPTSEAWEQIYGPLIAQTILAQDPTLNKARQLLRVARVPVAAATPEAAIQSILSVLFFNVVSAADAVERLGGQPFDNRLRWYWGSENDLLLNRKVQRITADPAALLELQRYATSGRTRIPLVMPHTTRDEVVLFDQTLLYVLKAQPIERGKVTPIPVARYGHCRFTATELVLSFALLVFQTTGRLPQTLAEQAADLQRPGAEAELAAYLEAFQAAEAADAAAQAGAPWVRVYLPLVRR